MRLEKRAQVSRTALLLAPIGAIALPAANVSPASPYDGAFSSCGCSA